MWTFSSQWHYQTILGTLTNFLTSIDSEQHHRNDILTRILAFMFYTPYKQTENMNYLSCPIFCFYFKISTFTYKLYFWFFVQKN